MAAALEEVEVEGKSCDEEKAARKGEEVGKENEEGASVQRSERAHHFNSGRRIEWQSNELWQLSSRMQ